MAESTGKSTSSNAAKSGSRSTAKSGAPTKAAPAAKSAAAAKSQSSGQAASTPQAEQRRRRAARRRAEQEAAAQRSRAPLVGVIMGSDSDYPVMAEAVQVLRDFEVPHEVEVVSAHRTPEKMGTYAREATGRGLRVIIAGAGGAAHLPGMVASMTTLPVIGVPVPLSRLDGMDSLLSIVQMPGGIPVATVSIGGAKNAGLLAVRILATNDSELAESLDEYARGLSEMVEEKNSALQERVAAEAAEAAAEHDSGD